MIQPSLSSNQYGYMQNMDSLEKGWDDPPEGPVSRLHQSIGHVNISKLRRKQEAGPVAKAPPRTSSRTQPEVEIHPLRPATAAPPGISIYMVFCQWHRERLRRCVSSLHVILSSIYLKRGMVRHVCACCMCAVYNML